MEKRAIAVIGAGFGDEGKGRMVDYFARECGQNTAVVRFNGGAQAGHTVKQPSGLRHVFHHFGSGTLRRVRTYLSRDFICNPTLYVEEMGELVNKGHQPSVAIHPAARVTTPFDMLLNQCVENARGGKRHGSCGVGINETVARCERGYALYAADLLHPDVLASRLDDICRFYLPSRVEELALDEFELTISTATIREKFLAECATMTQTSEVWDTTYLSDTPELIFEGAQGLLLDENHHFFPHVTRSRTGLANVARIAHEIDLPKVEAVYVTRPYMTRHGAGPFPTEDKHLSFPDPTNVPHPYQGTLRFGHLNLALIGAAIHHDLRVFGQLLDCDASLALTCVDQMEESTIRVIGAALERDVLPVKYLGFGPTAHETLAGDDLVEWREHPSKRAQVANG